MEVLACPVCHQFDEIRKISGVGFAAKIAVYSKTSTPLANRFAAKIDNGSNITCSVIGLGLLGGMLIVSAIIGILLIALSPGWDGSASYASYQESYRNAWIGVVGSAILGSASLGFALLILWISKNKLTQISTRFHKGQERLARSYYCVRDDYAYDTTSGGTPEQFTSNCFR